MLPVDSRRVAVLGATGSIGASALDVIARHPGRLRATVLAAGSRVDALLALCRTHAPEHAVIADEAAYPALREGLRVAGLATQAHCGDAALQALVAGDACDTVKQLNCAKFEFSGQDGCCIQDGDTIKFFECAGTD